MIESYKTNKNPFSGFLILLFTFFFAAATAQKQDIKPTISPAIFTYETEITVTYDVTGTPLASLTNAWIWVWIPDTNIDAKYNVNPASDNPTLTDNAKFTKAVADGKTTFTIKFKPKDFFASDISNQQKLGMLLKGNDWANGQTTDFIANIAAANEFSALLVKPTTIPVFINTNSSLDIEALSSDAATFRLSINGIQVDEKTGISSYTYAHLATETTGIIECSLKVSSTTTVEDTTMTFSYIIRSATTELPRPSGIIPGINYHPGDATKATLCLLAPNKSSVFVLGDFNDFIVSPSYQMYRDGEYFWREITGLIPGTEYAFQYLVDETIYVADPYTDKILDPDDQYIPSTIYPNLKSYPQKALHSKWYQNRLGIIQTNKTEYAWINDAYSKPQKENLIVYELLIRDFFDSNNRSYNKLIDTLSYLKNLGINAIELMPVMEFQGNSSWGYNPTFMFAPDKAYGTSQKLKEFIDVAHGQGIAVILDIVFNHQDIPNTYAAMYFDFTEGVFKPTPDNPWFNVTATHPYSVFFDMNHESSYTQQYMDTTLHYWRHQYHVDGFRFDLSKGFTQTNSGSDVGKWGQKDQSRIDIITGMADKVWSHSPETWLILEHFADNSEETILADHGLMLWGNMHGSYKETILGYHENNKSDLRWGYAPYRGWSDLNLITYMESHDEERQMYEAGLYGNGSGDYSVKDKTTALNRIKAASTFLYTVPGPKLFWQFGELGYDISIEENGRTGEKPLKWDYYSDSERKKLHDLTAELLEFRTTNNIFTEGQFLWSPEGEIKRLLLGDDNMKMLIIGNFGVVDHMIAGNFPEPGEWFDFFSGDSYDVVNTGMEMFFEPGEFHIYTTKKIEGVKTGLVPWGANFVITALPEDLASRQTIYPNPVNNHFTISGLKNGQYSMQVLDIHGQPVKHAEISLNSGFQGSIQELPSGFYFLKLTNATEEYTFKLLKN
jgi:glycosidase